MAEQEQNHRLAMEKAGLQANIEVSKEIQIQTRRGQIIGSTAVYLAIIAAVVTVYLGAHPSVSIALVSVPILGMVKALLGKPQQPTNQ